MQYLNATFFSGRSIKDSSLKKDVATPSLTQLQNGDWFFKKQSSDGQKTVYFITQEGHQHFMTQASREGRQFDEYYFEVSKDGNIVPVEAHDYNRIYEGNGWKYKFILECLDYRTPSVTANAFLNLLKSKKIDSSNLRLLDLAAGSGLGYEQLVNKGYRGKALGQDVVPNAKQAAQIGLKKPYDEYVVAPLAEAGKPVLNVIKHFKPNALYVSSGIEVTEHIGPKDIAIAINQLDFDGKDELPAVFSMHPRISSDEAHPTMVFLDLLKKLGVIDFVDEKEYKHRSTINGESINYHLVTAVLKKGLPEEILNQVDRLQKDYQEYQL